MTHHPPQNKAKRFVLASLSKAALALLIVLLTAGSCTEAPETMGEVVAISAGTHSLALKRDGTVVSWTNYGETGVPEGLSNVAKISAGDEVNLFIFRGSGAVVEFSHHAETYSNMPKNLEGVTDVSTGGHARLALRVDGKIVAWGHDNGLNDVPGDLGIVSAISADGYYNLALQTDGKVRTWSHSYNLVSVIPKDLGEVTAISAGGAHSLALQKDSTVRAWLVPGHGSNQGQEKVPSGLKDVTAVSAGEAHSLALKKDGTVVAWGSNYACQSAVPADLKDVVAISAGVYHSMALQRDGTVVVWGSYAGTPPEGIKVRTVDCSTAGPVPAPTSFNLESTSFPEDVSSGTVVGTFVSPGTPNVSYSLVAGEGGADNASFTIDSNTLKTAASFDFEIKSSYSIRVEARNSAGAVEESFVLEVTDVNETPVDTTKPTLTFTDPGPLLVNRPVTLTGSAADDTGVSKLELYEGDTLLGAATLTNTTWSYSYTPSAAGSVTFKAVATDAARNTAEASRSTIVYSNVVTNLNDAGEGSLRQLLLDTPAGETIGFFPTLLGETLTLTSGPLAVDKNVTITGDVTLSGNNASKVLVVAADVTADLKDLTITEGQDPRGGGIENGGTLTLSGKTRVTGNTAVDFGYGGGVLNDGTLVLKDDASITNNTSFTIGGGVWGGYSSVTTLQDRAVISNNSAESEGGGIFTNGTIIGANYSDGNPDDDDPSDDNVFNNSPDQVVLYGPGAG